MVSVRNIFIILSIVLFFGCSNKKELKFNVKPIANDATAWWARALGDINGDGLLDVALQNDNANGGWLGWLEGTRDSNMWKQHIIAGGDISADSFACGDFDIGDIDNDGDIDLLGFKHTGERDGAGDPTEIFWYSNPEWKETYIGQVPNFIKDVSLADLNNDGKLDMVTVCYVNNTLSILRQDSPAKWVLVHEIIIKNLHEGLDVGDIDGDGDIDIATDGYWLENPGDDFSDEWNLYVIDEKWNNQEGDWSINATKIFCKDINGNGRTEVFISHSEFKGYPVSWYESESPKEGNWKEHIIAPDLPAVHTLQVFDFDLDGDMDVLAGVNKGRAKKIGYKEFPITIYLNQGNNEKWLPLVLSKDGIYNGQVGDLEGDGDLDIFRIDMHWATKFEVLVNKYN